MKNFRINRLEYIFENKEYKNVIIDFTDFTLINGSNTSGKTGVFNTIDTMLGRNKLDYIKFEDEFVFSDTILTFERDGLTNKVQYKYSYNDGQRKLSKILYNDRPIALNNLNGKLTNVIFGTMFEDETKFGIRNMIIFNFFHEHNVGSPTVLLSKLREQFFYKNIQDTFQIALFKEHNGINALKLELRDLNIQLNILNNDLTVAQKSNNEITEINKLIEGKENKFKYGENTEKLLELHDLRQIKRELTENQVLNAELDFLSEARLMYGTTNELPELEELLVSIRASVLRKKYLKDNISKSIKDIEKSIDLNESSKRNALIQLFGNQKIDSLDTIEKKIKNCQERILHVKNQINDYEKQFEKKIVLVEKQMKSYLLKVKNTDLQNFLKSNSDFDIKIYGNSFDPSILSKDYKSKKIRLCH